jgi:hypothetical protein
MKKLLPIAVIAVMGLLSFASCSKKSSSSKCTCTTPGVTKDTTFSFTNAGSYSSLSAACSSLDSGYKAIGSAYGCHL